MRLPSLHLPRRDVLLVSVLLGTLWAVPGAAEPSGLAAAASLTALESEDARRADSGFVVSLSGYVQAQYQTDQLSQDEVQQGGTLLNQDRFVVRRGRLRATAQWAQFTGVLEVDGSTTRGPFTSVRRAQVQWALPGSAGGEPLVAVTAGLTGIPFGHELRVAQDALPLHERSTGSLAWFPGPPDVGVRLHGALGAFRYDVGMFGGAPLDDRAGALLQDATRAPDWIGRLGVDGRPIAPLRLRGGLSLLLGTGFSPGVQASKPRLEWRDFDNDGTLDDGEIAAIPGQSARASATFERWALAVDAVADLTSKLGQSQLHLEAAVATDLDRGLFVADPVLSGIQQRSINWVASLAHDAALTPSLGLLLSLRWSLYQPDLDFLDDRRGTLLPDDQSITAWSPLVGVRWGRNVQLTAQWDLLQDRLARDRNGVPADVANNRFALRAQVRF